jgi:hypothetical protein
MAHLARVHRLSGPTHGRPPCSFPPSPGDVVPMVPDLVTPARAHVWKIEAALDLLHLRGGPATAARKGKNVVDMEEEGRKVASLGRWCDVPALSKDNLS